MVVKVYISGISGNKEVRIIWYTRMSGRYVYHKTRCHERENIGSMCDGLDSGQVYAYFNRQQDKSVVTISKQWFNR
jgi:hypothetical protein